MEKIQPGELTEGLVTRLMDFGAFVDIGGVEGLIHISKLSWSRVKHPSEVLEVGQKVKVKIEKVIAETGKISLSHRDTIEHPWEGINERFPVNAIVKGKISRLAQFGAFVELAPGIEGLIHISELAHHRVLAVKNIVKEGDEVEVKILSVDADGQKLGLSLKATQAAPERKDKAKEQDDSDLPARELAVAESRAPLRGGTGRASGGDKFGLNL
jgi:small subunit ribosomal protein S1